MKMSPFLPQSSQVYRPSFFDLSRPMDRLAFDDLLHRFPQLELVDQIETQLHALMEALQISNYEQISRFLEDELGGRTFEQYGVWVYYPWLHKVVHLLPREAFYQLRLTEEELDVEPGRKVGIADAQRSWPLVRRLVREQACTELRIASSLPVGMQQFRLLEAGIHELGQSPSIRLARQIAELDPYLPIRCYDDPLAEDFFLEGGKLDLLIDGTPKLSQHDRLHQRAAALGVPVIPRLEPGESYSFREMPAVRPDGHLASAASGR